MTDQTWWLDPECAWWAKADCAKVTSTPWLGK